jgi:hypothetical protein
METTEKHESNEEHEAAKIPMKRLVIPTDEWSVTGGVKIAGNQIANHPDQ